MARALDLAGRIVGQSKALARVWPGYWPETQPFIINFPGSGALLVMHGNPPEGWEPMRARDVPPQLRGRVFFRRGDIEGATRPFIIDFPVGGGQTAILVNPGRGVADTAGLLFHERFHFYQMSRFRSLVSVGEFLAPSAVADRVAFAASAELERRILAAAVTRRSGPQQIELLRQYLAVRRAREAALPPQAVKLEQQFERSEGVARYVEGVARHLVFRTPRVEAQLADWLRASLAEEPGGFTMVWFRLRSYSAGAALTHLLSRLDPQGWRRAIEDGGVLVDMVEQKVGRAPDPVRAAEAARRRFGYAELVTQLEAPLREAERQEIKSVDDFRALGRYAVAVEIKITPTNRAVRTPSFSASEMAFLSPTDMVLRHVEVLTMGSGGTELTVRGRPVMMDNFEGHKRTTVLLDAQPRLEGGAALALGSHRLNGIRIREPGLELRLDGPVLVTVEESGMRIRYPAPD
jgi:hypothetical protein